MRRSRGAQQRQRQRTIVVLLPLNVRFLTRLLKALLRGHFYHLRARTLIQFGVGRQ